MAVIDDFITYFTSLDASNSILTAFNNNETYGQFIFADNLFSLTIPGAPDNILVLNPYSGGNAPDTVRRVYYPNIQILIRHTNPRAALDTGQACIDRLHLNTTIVNGKCFAVNSIPLDLGNDEINRRRYSVNFLIKQRLTS